MLTDKHNTLARTLVSEVILRIIKDLFLAKV